MKEIYLDSNVIMKLLLEADTDVRKIMEASQGGRIRTYVSWLSLSEVSSSVTRTERGSKLSPQISEILARNRILVLSRPDRSLSSGSAWTPTLDLDYSDHLHLLIAKRAKVDYFVTYDHDLLSKKQIESITILTPHDFVRQVLEVKG